MRNGKIYRYDDPFWSTFYRPNLDLYPEKLAHQFAKVEMSGEEFKLEYKRFENAYFLEKEKLGFTKMEKIKDKEEIILIQNIASMNFHFAAGRLSNKDVSLLEMDRATVWFSDQSLIKQLNSRLGDPKFNIDSYTWVPEAIFSADKIYRGDDGRLIVVKNMDGRLFEVIFKYLPNKKESFVISARWTSEKKLRSEAKKYEVVR